MHILTRITIVWDILLRNSLLVSLLHVTRPCGPCIYTHTHTCKQAISIQQYREWTACALIFHIFHGYVCSLFECPTLLWKTCYFYTFNIAMSTSGCVNTFLIRRQIWTCTSHYRMQHIFFLPQPDIISINYLSCFDLAMLSEQSRNSSNLTCIGDLLHRLKYLVNFMHSLPVSMNGVVNKVNGRWSNSVTRKMEL